MAPTSKPFEEGAKHFLAETLGGQVVVRDTGGASGMRDFDLVDANQNILHGIEVTSVQHPTVRSTRVELRKLSESDLQLKNSWSITVHEEVAVRALREHAPEHLNRLTDLGVNGFAQSGRRDAVAADTIDALHRLGIVQAQAMPDLLPPRLVPGSYGAGSLDAVRITDAVEAELWKADNRKKLATVPAGAQRHMFVGLDHSHWYVSSQLIDGDAVMPPPPSLPPEVDAAWIGVEDPASGELAIVIRVDANGSEALDGTGHTLSLTPQADGPPADAGPCLECNGPGRWRPELRLRYDPQADHQTKRWVWVARCEADEAHWQLPGRSLTAREREALADKPKEA